MKHSILNMGTKRRIVSLAVAFAMLLIPALALAVDLDIGDGDIIIDGTKYTQSEKTGSHGGRVNIINKAVDATANTVDINIEEDETVAVAITGVYFSLETVTAIGISGAGTVNMTLNGIYVTAGGEAEPIPAMSVADANVEITVEGVNTIESEEGPGLLISSGSVTVTGDSTSDMLKVSSNKSSAIAGEEGTLTVKRNAVVEATVSTGADASPIGNGIIVNGSQTTGYDQSDNTATTTVRSHSAAAGDTATSGGGQNDVDLGILDLIVSVDPDKKLELPISIQPGCKLTVNDIRVDLAMSDNNRPLISAGTLIAVANAETLAELSEQSKGIFLVNNTNQICFLGGTGIFKLDTNDSSTWPDDLFATVGAASAAAQEPTLKQQELLVAINSKLGAGAPPIDFSTLIDLLTETYEEFAGGQGQAFDTPAFEQKLVNLFNISLEELRQAWDGVDVLDWLKQRCEAQEAPNEAKIQAVARMLPENREGAEQLSGADFTFALNGNTVARAKIEEDWNEK